MAKLQVVGHRVLVKPDDVSDRTNGGLYLSQQTVDRERTAVVRGTVVGVGENCWLEFGNGRPWAKVGDRVIYAKYGGWEILEEEDGKKVPYRILNDEDIMVVIQDDKE